MVSPSGSYSGSPGMPRMRTSSLHRAMGVAFGGAVDIDRFVNTRNLTPTQKQTAKLALEVLLQVISQKQQKQQQQQQQQQKKKKLQKHQKQRQKKLQKKKKKKKKSSLDGFLFQTTSTHNFCQQFSGLQL